MNDTFFLHLPLKLPLQEFVFLQLATINQRNVEVTGKLPHERSSKQSSVTAADDSIILYGKMSRHNCLTVYLKYTDAPTSTACDIENGFLPSV